MHATEFHRAQRLHRKGQTFRNQRYLRFIGVEPGGEHGFTVVEVDLQRGTVHQNVQLQGLIAYSGAADRAAAAQGIPGEAQADQPAAAVTLQVQPAGQRQGEISLGYAL